MCSAKGPSEMTRPILNYLAHELHFPQVGVTGILTEGNTMLVLTRKSGQQIVIDSDIRVTILEVQGNRVRLGISAPVDVKVDRKELEERNKRVRRAQVKR
jgi:carbon storage regulator